MPPPLLLKSIALGPAAAAIPAVALSCSSLADLPLPLRVSAAALGIAVLAAEVYLAHLLLPQWDRWLWRMRRLHRGERLALLTFDDGPETPWTEAILDVLRREGVRATFFVCGEKAAERPDLVRRIVEEGHEIGNHTTSHRILLHRRAPRIREEIEHTNRVIEAITGKRPRLFRAPHGFKAPRLRRILKGFDLQLIPWTKGIWDTDGASATVLLGRFRKRVSDFEILLLHDGADGGGPSRCREATARILPAIISEYRRRGHRFVSCAELTPGNAEG